MSKREKENINAKEISCNPNVKKKLRNEWQQTESEVIITLYPGNSKVNYNLENVKFKSSESSCSIIFKDGRAWTCDLYRVVVPEGTSIQFKSNKVILKMVKKAPEMWKQLEARKEDEMSEDSDSMEPSSDTDNLHLPKPDTEKQVIELQNLNTTYYQKNLESLNLVVYIKNIKKDELVVLFEETQLTIKFKTDDPQILSTYESVGATSSTTFVWSICLKATIKPQQCRYKIFDKKLEIVLEKEYPFRWSGLEGVQSEVKFDNTPTSSWVPILKQDSPLDNVTRSVYDPNLPSTSVVSENTIGNLYDEVTVGKKDAKPTCLVSPLNKNQIIGQASYGLTGLDNLGNTCFINSVLQCLANTSELKEFFLSGIFQKDINVENPLGLNGHLAVTFAVLLKNLWMGVQHSYSPSKLKMLIGQKVTQFSGFAQHDAQEFMSFFLDGLHEDLNRIKNKPYMENVSLDDKTDEIAAEIAWQNYKKRNDSIVVDLFQGQYKSKLVCPTCSKVSITFDPFLYLSLPLPKDNCVIPVYFFSKDPRGKPRKYLLKLPVDSVFENLKTVLGLKTNIPPDRLIGFTVTKQEPMVLLTEKIPIGQIFYLNKGEKIFIFEVFDKKLVGEPLVEFTVVQRLLVPELKKNECSFCSKESLTTEHKLKRCTKCMRVAYCNVNCQRSHWPDHKVCCVEEAYTLGLPFFISLPKSQTTFSVIYRLLEAYSRYSVDVFQPPLNLHSTKLNQSLDLEVQEQSVAVSEDLDNVDQETQARNDTEKAMSEMDLSSAEDKDSLDVSPKDRPARLVIGQQPGGKTFAPLFLIRPVDKFGRSLSKTCEDVLDDKGNEPLDFSNYKYLAMDWKNDYRVAKQYSSSGSYNYPNYVLVQSKELDWEYDDEEVILENNLYDCLTLYTEPEVLSSKDSWYCPACKEHRNATKQLSLWRLPPVLIIQLKRFSYGGFLHFREKLDKMIDFPIRGLDLSPYICQSPSNDLSSPIYDLYAVVNHIGSRSLYGHYTSFARCLDSTDSRLSQIDWRLFDDSRVSFISESLVSSEAAYVLFYRQRNKPFSVPIPNIPVLCKTSSPRENNAEVDKDSSCASAVNSDNSSVDTCNSELDMLD